MSVREGAGRPGKKGKGAAVEETPTTLQRIQARSEQILRWFPEMRKTLVQEGESGLESILAQISSLGGQVSKRAQATGQGLEARAERLLSELEHQAARGLKPILSRANVPSHTDLASMDARLAHLEGRIGALLDERSELHGRMAQLEHALAEARADASERVRDLQLRLSIADELHRELATVHEHLDALSKDQVTRSLALGKLDDRVVRIEMRLGDVLKDQSARATEHDDAKRRLLALERSSEEARQLLHAASDQAMQVTASARQHASRLAALSDERATDRGEMALLTGRAAEVERSFRQLSLQLGDLLERQAGMREELTSFAARVSQLELRAARPSSVAPTIEHAEGH